MLEASEPTGCAKNLRGRIPETRRALVPLPSINTATERQVGTVFPALPTNMKCWRDYEDSTNKYDEQQKNLALVATATTPLPQEMITFVDLLRVQLTRSER